MSDEAWREQHVIFEQAALRLLRCPYPSLRRSKALPWAADVS